MNILHSFAVPVHVKITFPPQQLRDLYLATDDHELAALREL
jgi:hypothetical protein